MRRQLLPALRVTVVLTILTGLAYPLLVTGVAQLAFPDQANSSLVERDGQVVGSAIMGQVFEAEEYFSSRPSASGENGYDGQASSGSNAGPTNEEFLATVSERVAAYREVNGLPDDQPIPADAVTASGSGWDPHISVANAELQAARVAEARGLDEARVLELVGEHTHGRSLGFLGEPGVNVLALNLALDEDADA